MTTGQPVYHGPARLVGAIRLSRYSDASTSVEVQEESIANTGMRLGGTFVGWARDADVSALKTTPWEREELVYWLDRPDEWDALIWQRMDRAVRSMADMADLGRFAKKHGKRLVFASGPGGAMLELDFSSPISELLMLILAFAAQLEGQTIMERNQGAAAHLQSLGRWAGGPVPYGFVPTRKTFRDGKEGWWLAVDAETKKPDIVATGPIVCQMVAQALAGKSYAAITRWLDESGSITPKNHRARLATPPREADPESRWRVTVVRDILRSPLLRGYTVKRDGTTVRDGTGAPVLQGDPIVDDKTWRQLQDALEENTRPEMSQPRRKGGHYLLGVAECGICERNMFASWYRERPTKAFPDGRKRPTLRCHGHDHEAGVPAQSIHLDGVLDYVDREFMRRLGSFRQTMAVRTAGHDYRAEITELEADVGDLAERLVGLRGAAAKAVERQLQGVSDRLEELHANPYSPPVEEVVELEETYGEAYQAADRNGRQKILLDAHVKVRVHPPTGWRQPADTRLTFHIGESEDPEALAREGLAVQLEA